MNDLPVPSGPLPKEWLNKWQIEAPVPLIPTWEDPTLFMNQFLESRN